MEKGGIAQNQFYFSQNIEFATRNQLLKNLNFIPILSLDISDQIKSDVQVYHQKFRLHEDKTYEKMNLANHNTSNMNRQH